MIELRNYFQGQFQAPPKSGRDSSDITLERYNPANTTQKIWQYDVCPTHITSVIDSSIEGFFLWKKTTLSERKNYLTQYLKKLDQKKHELASTLTLENGQNLKYHWDELELLIQQGPELLTILEAKLQSTDQCFSTPRGPAVLIASFCRPLYFAHRFLMNNLMAGNSILIKPSEKVGLTLEKLFECLHQAEFPKGVVNLIHGQGHGEVSKKLMKEKRLRIVNFIGSQEVGSALYEQSPTDTERSLSFSLSQKNIAIFAPEFDELKLLNNLPNAVYQYAGQDCFSPSLIFIPKKRARDFIEKFHQESKKISINAPQQDNPQMGPLIDQQAMDNYILSMGMAKREGLEEIMRGKQIDRSPKGYFVSPSIHYTDSFKAKSLFIQSNFLGPNVTFIGYDEFSEIISMANSIECSSLISVHGANSSEFQLCKEQLETHCLLHDKLSSEAFKEIQLSVDFLESCRKKVYLF